jgi:hypothetical protein
MPETFGVEIETGFRRNVGNFDTLLAAMRAEGLSVIDQRDRHFGFDHESWSLKYDATVGRGCEVVSPPLRFDKEEDRAQVDKAMRALLMGGCEVRDEAGIHVHVNASDLSARQIANIVRFVYKFEDVLYRIASSGWDQIRSAALRDPYEGEAYAKEITEEMAKRMMKVRDEDALTRAWGGSRWNSEGDRYHAVNLTPWWSMGTVEFRMFNTTLNAERLQAYIAIAVAIVRDARNGQARQVKTHYPLGSMARDPRKAKAMFLRFQQVMTTKSGDSAKSNRADLPPLMSKQDWKRVLFCWKDSFAQVPRTSRRFR